MFLNALKEINKLDNFIFPSGHTLSSFAVSEMLSMYYPKYDFIFIVIAFLIALSRIYLYVHYPSDIIAGIIIGVLFTKFILIGLQAGNIFKIYLPSEIYLK